MKAFTPLLLALLASASLHAAPIKEITSLKGKTYYQCEIVQVHPDGVAFTHANGAAKVLFTDLPQTWRDRLGYDPQKAKAYEREQAEMQRQQQTTAEMKFLDLEDDLKRSQPWEEQIPGLLALWYSFENRASPGAKNFISGPFYPDFFEVRNPHNESNCLDASPFYPDIFEVRNPASSEALYPRLTQDGNLRSGYAPEDQETAAHQVIHRYRDEEADAMLMAQQMELARLHREELQARVDLEAAAKAPLPDPPLVPVLPALGEVFDSSDYHGSGFHDQQAWYFPNYFGYSYGSYPIYRGCPLYYRGLGAEIQTRIGNVTFSVGR